MCFRFCQNKQKGVIIKPSTFELRSTKEWCLSVLLCSMSEAGGGSKT